MRIGGLQKFSLIDYPKKVAAVIFTQGCDFRCPFCHNPDLVLAERFSTPLSEEKVLEFLRKRQSQLSGVVVTGGEPTIHKDLSDFLRKIKSLGYDIKLDTNGNNPEALKNLIDQKLIDYIAMDVKTSLPRYDEAAGIHVDVDKIKTSIGLIIDSGIEYHFRTTVVHKFISSKELEDIYDYLKEAKKYFLQEFVPAGELLDENLKDSRVYSEEEFKELQKGWEKR